MRCHGYLIHLYQLAHGKIGFISLKVEESIEDVN